MNGNSHSTLVILATPLTQTTTPPICPVTVAISAVKYFENVNNHKYISLGEIGEPEDNCLRFTIEEAGISDEESTIEMLASEMSGLRSIEVADKCCVCEVTFDVYIGCSALNESYVSVDEHEEFGGPLFCIYKKSYYLSYLSKVCFATADCPVPFRHYGVNCLSHIFDVISRGYPSIKLISGRHFAGQIARA